MLLHDFLGDSARRLGDKTAIICRADRLSFGEIDRRADRLARALVRRGVTRGDRVAILGDARPEALIAVWATLKANAIFMVVSRDIREDRLAYILRDSGARALIGPARAIARVNVATAMAPELAVAIAHGGAPPPLRGASSTAWDEALEGEEDAPPRRLTIDQDLAAIVYTSGSTGEPKGVMLTHACMIAAATSITTYLEAREDDIVLDALPLAFDYGLYQVLMAARVGATVVLEDGFAFPGAVLDVVESERVTALPGVPTMFAILAQMGEMERDLSRVRYVTSTAAALPASHIQVIRGLFPRARIYSMYGLTECKRCTYLPPDDLDRKPGSVGIAIPNTELWIRGRHREAGRPGRGGRAGDPRRHGHARLLAQAGGDVRAAAPRPRRGRARPPHRRPLQARRGRLPLLRRAPGRRHRNLAARRWRRERSRMLSMRCRACARLPSSACRIRSSAKQ